MKQHYKITATFVVSIDFERSLKDGELEKVGQAMANGLLRRGNGHGSTVEGMGMIFSNVVSPEVELKEIIRTRRFMPKKV